MTKFVIAILVLVLAYFAFHTRTEPPKEVQVEEVSKIETSEPELIQTKEIVTVPLSSATTIVEASVSAPVLETAEVETETEAVIEKDEPRENVDQTVIANEKKLAASSSAAEVFELLQKLRIRMKKLSEISTVGKTADYAKFYGIFEGTVVNRRGESVYTLKLEIKDAQIDSNFEINKGKNGKVKGYFNGDYGMQLVGRDALVISDATESNNFQLYKLDNGMVAGTYYEKRKASYRTYKFILKKK